MTHVVSRLSSLLKTQKDGDSVESWVFDIWAWLTPDRLVFCVTEKVHSLCDYFDNGFSFFCCVLELVVVGVSFWMTI